MHTNLKHEKNQLNQIQFEQAQKNFNKYDALAPLNGSEPIVDSANEMKTDCDNYNRIKEFIS